MPDIKDIDALTSLGLTVLQAKIFFALTKTRKATIKTLAKNSNIARQDIYRLTTELQEIGLIEKIIATPIEYKAISMQEGIKLLLQKKNTEMEEIRKKANALLKRQRTENKNQQHEAKSQFTLIPEKTALVLKLKKEIDFAKNSVNVICSWKKFIQGFSSLGEEMNNAINRDVMFRFIVQKPKQNESWSNSAKNFCKKPSFKIRFLNKIPECIIGIYDKKEMLITISAEGNFSESPALWSNNPCFISIFQDLFESQWKKAKTDNKSSKPNFKMDRQIIV
ncbi:MAG: hypothetical protein GX638_01245 [Crenarchaeota archaeon]|nr:hypothetical protein [Thermoproteota archaeon]